MEPDINVVKETLYWARIKARNEARFLPIIAPDSALDSVCGSWRIAELPQLAVASNPAMEPRLLVGSQALAKLSTQNGLLNFLFTVHIQLKNDLSIQDLRTSMREQEFWSWMRWAGGSFSNF